MDEEQNKQAETRQSHEKKRIKWKITPKGRKTACVGDMVIHPNGIVGVIKEGAPTVTYGGRAAARIGDKVECPGHSGVILQGAKTVSIGKKAIAREGDRTSCGGTIINGYPTITVLDKTLNAYGEGEREIRFKLTQSSHSTDNSYIAMPYEIYVDGGKVGEGLTDEEGELILLMDDKKEIKEYEIRFANGRTYLLSVIDEFEDNTEKDKVTPKGFPAYEDLGVDYAKAYDDVASGKLNTGWKK